MKDQLSCPHCGKPVFRYRNPFPTVDIIIEMEGCAPYGAAPEHTPNSIVLIKRKNPPYGWALPGGFVDYGESLESAAIREAQEETSLEVTLSYQLGAYSDPSRDPRHHSISVVFVAKPFAHDQNHGPIAADDAEEVGIFNRDTLPEPLVFDHEKILRAYFLKNAALKKCGEKG
ncbi:MAG: NUDIX hydrolase [Desulfobacteraceae bacterium 4572_87]|nr:MAG: NUDIX hydrolase [Desulfobacteraceae bacterium 4572_87]